MYARDVKKNMTVFLTALLLFVDVIHFTVPAGASDSRTGDVEAFTFQRDTYAYYKESHGDSSQGSEEITVSAAEGVSLRNEVIDEKQAVILEDGQKASYQFTIKDAGYYNLAVEYYPTEGKGLDFTLGFEIDGVSPFAEAGEISFPRLYKDESHKKYDANDNQLRSSSIEAKNWITAYAADTTGYYNEDFKFYLTEGAHTLEVVAVEERIAIHALHIKTRPQPLSYRDYYRQLSEKGVQKTENVYQVIQAEEASLKSSRTLYPLYDRVSPLTEPYSVSKIRLNYIGGVNWKFPGQWIEWELETKEEGFYQIALRTRQSYKSGLYSSRRIYINGEVPFQEAQCVEFGYHTDWKNETLNDKEGNAYWFYLKKGVNTLRMEEISGNLSEAVMILNDALTNLNALYRSIIMLTGANPDPYRDYEFEKHIKGINEMLLKYGNTLAEQKKKIEETAGGPGESLSVLESFSLQLKSIADKPHTIPERLEDFRANISALSSLLIGLVQQPLDLDCITLKSEDKKLPKSDVGFFGGLVNEIKSLFYSFIIDYSVIGNLDNGGTRIDVWVPSGRDQANLIKHISGESFTQKYNINIQVSLVDIGSLLPAIVARKAPDVVVNVPRDVPVNYGVRGSLVDLAEFNDFDETAKRFQESAVVPLGFDGKVYALPETQSYHMMFFRKDIFTDLKLTPPDTWEEFTRVAARLKKKNLEVGIPFDDVNSFAAFLFQNKGTYYTENGSRCMLGEEAGINAFIQWTKLKTDYNLPLTFDFTNRFKTGEMPLAIADFTAYNNLCVFAPEINGLWAMTPIPGTMEDGTLNRSQTSAGVNVVMLRQSEKNEAAWSFIKWWTSAEVQREYGSELEVLMGASARYPTANKEAFAKIPWSSGQYKEIESQRQWIKPVEEVVGGYFTARHLLNAFRAVAIADKDPRDTLLDYVDIINQEIKEKRIELGVRQ